MSDIKSVEDLRAAILHLESLQKQQGKALKSELLVSVESLKPSSLIRATFKDLSQSQEFRWTVLSVGVGLTTALLSRAISRGAVKQPAMKVLGYLVVLAATEVVARNPDRIKAAGKFCFDLLRSRRNREYAHGFSEVLSASGDHQLLETNRP